MKQAMASSSQGNVSAIPAIETSFQEKRKEIVAEVAQSGKKNEYDSGETSEHRFVGGGSK